MNRGMSPDSGSGPTICWEFKETPFWLIVLSQPQRSSFSDRKRACKARCSQFLVVRPPVTSKESIQPKLASQVEIWNSCLEKGGRARLVKLEFLASIYFS